MSRDSFNKSWGPISSVTLGFLIYKIPEIFITGLAPFVISLLPKSENIRNFILYGLFEALTIGVLYLILIWYGHRFSDIGFGRFKVGYVAKALLGFFSYFVITSIVLDVVSKFYTIPDQKQAIGFSDPNSFELVLAFVALVCIVPIAEELLFRGFIYKGIRSGFSFPVTALVVSVLFAVAHGQLNVGLDVFCLSLVLCYVRERTDSIWPGIVLHGLKNTVAFLLLFIYNV